MLSVLESGKRPKGGVGEYQNGIPSLGGEHIGLNGKIKVFKDNLKFVPVEYFEKSKQGKIKNLDILICKDGALTGKIALFYKNDIDFPQSIINEHVFLLRTNQNTNQKYLFNILFSSKGQELLKSNISGQAQGGLNRANLLNIKIPLPPKEVQEKIVTEIDKLEKRDIKALEGIKKFQNSISQYIQELNNHSKINLSDIAENWDSKRKPVTKGDRTKGKYPYYGASGIVDYVSGFILDDTVLLISEDGANLKSRVYPIAFTASGKIWVNNHAHILKFDNIATHKLVELYINQLDISEYITGQAQPKLNQNNLNNIKIPLPPVKEQERIVAEIEKLEIKIKALEKQIAEIPKLKENILKKHLE
ncbi:type I restriction-modification system specificity subunit S [Algibacter lectus]|uniref:Type I restriction-modification system specificity subunit S n=2 Tax=Algibacter lectus TaxID=221126 RepID=A0A090X2J9_9FLAO|nr:type I restriction-modification system specificity subunit S [Algibacter lectus]